MTNLRLDLQLAIEVADDACDDGESEPDGLLALCSLVTLAITDRADILKLAEDVLELLLGDAVTGIGDRDTDADAFALGLDGVFQIVVDDFAPLDEDAPLFRVLERVGNDIRDDLPDLCPITEYRLRRSARVLDDVEAEAAPGGLVAVHRNGFFESFGDVEGVRQEEIVALLRARQVLQMRFGVSPRAP